MSVPIAFGKKTEWKDGKQQETDEDNIINDAEPLWTKAPATLKDEDYKYFYRTLYPMQMDEPLFWIHLNVDFPFHLTGILYFPKIHSNIDLQRNKIQLYCNQVFVTDQVEGIVPEFLTLLHGVIDSPDIPLNVSRSYLQSDSNVKKIATYITKKVADRLNSLFKDSRQEYEEKWDALKLFIHYGMLSQEDFYDRAKEFALLKDVDGKYYSYEEYEKLIKEGQTDKDGTLVYLYATDKEAQYAYIKTAQQKGYSVLLFDGELDTHIVSMLEQKNEKTRYSRVDADTVNRLIPKAEEDKLDMTDDECSNLKEAFQSQMPAVDKADFHVDIKSLGEEAQPVVITQSEYMRRMKEMSRFQSGMNFYAQMPDTYSLILNADHKLIKDILKDENDNCDKSLQPIINEIKGLQARKQALQQMTEKKKADEVTQEEKDDIDKTTKDIAEQEQKKREVIAAYAKENKTIHQLIDLALLQNGMLKGEALNTFVKRSVELINTND